MCVYIYRGGFRGGGSKGSGPPPPFIPNMYEAIGYL